jgi:hypothetical protein
MNNSYKTREINNVRKCPKKNEQYNKNPENKYRNSNEKPVQNSKKNSTTNVSPKKIKSKNP